jgi:ankyrin repeat domain-containing protein 50
MSPFAVPVGLARSRNMLIHKSVEKRQKILRWLSSVDVSRNHTEACNRCEPYTGNWLLQSTAFQDWLNGQQRFVWIQGIAGCGKTVLTSSIIETVRSRQITDFGLGYFYFDFNEEGKRSPINALRSIVARMGISAAGPSGSLPQPITKFYDNLKMDGRQPTDKAGLLSTLQELVAGFERSYIILDALDECGEGEESLFPLIASLVSKLPKTCILVTSRNERDIEEGLERIPKKIIKVEGDAIAGDIRLFIRNQLKNDVRLSARPPKLLEEIETALVDRAQGM